MAKAAMSKAPTKAESARMLKKNWENLKKNWENLRREAGQNYSDIESLFVGSVDRLPEEPSNDDFERMVQQIRDPLLRYRSGHRVLDLIVAIIDDNPAAGGEPPAQKKNRFRELPKAKPATAKVRQAGARK